MKKYLSITTKTLEDLGVPTYKSLWEQAKKEGYDGLCLSIETVFTKASDNKFHATFSTDSVDRHGDVMKQEPDLKHFKKNPVYLDSHNYDSIEHIIGRVMGATTKNGKLEGDVEFFTDNPKGLLAKKAVEQGFLNTSSIGFIPHEFDEKTGAITKWELLEISAVSVPAQAEALFERVKSAEKTVKVDEKGVGTYEESGKTIRLKVGHALAGMVYAYAKEGEEPQIMCMGCDKFLNFTDAIAVDTEDPNVAELMCTECAEKKANAPEPEVPPAPTAPAKPTVASVIARMAENDRKQLKMIAKAVDHLVREDKDRNRRKLMQALRRAIDSNE